MGQAKRRKQMDPLFGLVSDKTIEILRALAQVRMLEPEPGILVHIPEGRKPLFGFLEQDNIKVDDNDRGPVLEQALKDYPYDKFIIIEWPGDQFYAIAWADIDYVLALKKLPPLETKRQDRGVPTHKIPKAVLG